MIVPEEFKRFTRCFLQGSFDEAIDERDWIRRALQLNSIEQRAVIKKFIVGLLSAETDLGELQKVWKSGQPSYGISDGHIRKFLEEVRDLIVD